MFAAPSHARAPRPRTTSRNRQRPPAMHGLPCGNPRPFGTLRRELTETANPDPRTGVIVVSRPRWGASDWFRSWSVMVGGKKAGKLRPGGSCRIQVQAGSHQVWCAVDWVRSNEVMVSVNAGEECQLTCRPAVNPWRWFRLSDAMTGQTPWMRLEDDSTG